MPDVDVLLVLAICECHRVVPLVCASHVVEGADLNEFDSV